MTARTRRYLWLAVILALVGGGMAWAIRPFWLYPVTNIEGRQLPPLPATVQTALLAGLAVRDITGPVGLPKMGYSALGKASNGFRTRLKARVVYLKPAIGEPVALVALDTGASSLLLHQLVAQRIAAHTDIAAHNLSLLATHTHNGLGQYLDNDFYNAFSANAPGFDADVTRFLVDQISSAVIEAYTHRRAAKVAMGETAIWGYTRNRSLPAWLANNNVTDKRDTPDRAYEAINPVMTMMRVDLRDNQGRFVPAGAFTSFSIHGTSIPSGYDAYHADVWTWIERDLEQHVRDTWAPPWPVVHAAVEGTHADNTPAWHEGRRGEVESERIGKGIAQEAVALFDRLGSQLQDNVPVSSTLHELDLLALDEETRDGLCARAIIGAATTGAATGDEQFPVSYLPWIKKGQPRRLFKEGCQGEKHWLFSALQPVLFSADRFPHHLAIQASRIGNRLFLSLPFEVTLESGNRIAAASDAVLRDKGLAGVRTVVMSHGNGFFGYATTPEEYSQQWYEGGHTIYGKFTAPFLARQSAAVTLALVTKGNHARMPNNWHYRLASRQFSPAPEPLNGQRHEIAAGAYVENQGEEPFWRWQVQDIGAYGIALHQPLARVDCRTGNSSGWITVADDEGTHMQIVFMSRLENGMAQWEWRWFHAPLLKDQQCRLVLAARQSLAEWFSTPVPLLAHAT